MLTGYIFDHSVIVGGGELSFIDLIDTVRNFGVNPVVFIPGAGEVKNKLNSLGIKTHEIDMPPIRAWTLPGLLAKHSYLARLFREMKLDIIHSNGSRCILYAGPAAYRAGLPFVWHVRVIDRDNIADKIRAHYTNTIVANSDAVAKSLRPFIGQSKQMEVVYNGFNIEKIESSDALDLTQVFGVPLGPVIIAVGRLSPWKKFEDIIKACAVLQDSNISFSLLVVGRALPHEKWYEQKLKQLVNDLLLRNVFFTGWRDDVSSIMKSASIMCLPSYNEPFGRVIVEAWACGVPVIATNLGGPAEIIKDGDTGILIENGNIKQLAETIIMLLKDQVLLNKLAKNGFKRASDFSITNHAEAIVNIYKKMLV